MSGVSTSIIHPEITEWVSLYYNNKIFNIESYIASIIRFAHNKISYGVVENRMEIPVTLSPGGP